MKIIAKATGKDQAVAFCNKGPSYLSMFLVYADTIAVYYSPATCIFGFFLVSWLTAARQGHLHDLCPGSHTILLFWVFDKEVLDRTSPVGNRDTSGFGRSIP